MSIEDPNKEGMQQTAEPIWERNGKWLMQSYIGQLQINNQAEQKEAIDGINEILTFGHPDYQQPEPEKNS